MKLSYVLPIRCDRSHGDHADLVSYLDRLAGEAEVIVADGSGSGCFEEHRADLPAGVRHVAPHPDLVFANGKVNGVTTGIREARHEHVVIADDDVRYRLEELEEIDRRLDEADLVVPQNYLAPGSWHVLWDTARSLINRATHTDYPGTLGIRRSLFLDMGGYDGDVLFENLELMRTVVAAGGRILRAPEILVRRTAPSLEVFLDQRIRQAYDDLAQPLRLAAFLSLLPWLAVSAVRGRWRHPLSAAVASVVVAEVGRRRAGGRRVFPTAASLFAPLWLLERGLCSWLAVAARVARGGARYRGRRLRRAANPLRTLRERQSGRRRPGAAPRA